jgi:hypothetical protein
MLTLLDERREQVRIRLAEIDTPARRQPYGTRAVDLCPTSLSARPCGSSLKIPIAAGALWAKFTSAHRTLTPRWSAAGLPRCIVAIATTPRCCALSRRRGLSVEGSGLYRPDRAILARRGGRRPPPTSSAARTTRGRRCVQRGTNVSIDLRRSRSLINPYTGIVVLSGPMETNARGPRANGWLDNTLVTEPARIACYRPPEEALAATGPGDMLPYNGGIVSDRRIVYAISTDAVTFDHANEPYINPYDRTDGRSQPENVSAWGTVLQRSLRSAPAPRNRQAR